MAFTNRKPTTQSKAEPETPSYLKDGEGFDVVLDAIPVTGRIVVRAPQRGGVAALAACPLGHAALPYF